MTGGPRTNEQTATAQNMMQTKSIGEGANPVRLVIESSLKVLDPTLLGGWQTDERTLRVYGRGGGAQHKSTLTSGFPFFCSVLATETRSVHRLTIMGHWT